MQLMTDSTTAHNRECATGISAWMVRITVFTAASTLGSEYTAAEIAAGVPSSQTVMVNTPSVPFQPTKSRVKS